MPRNFFDECCCSDNPSIVNAGSCVFPTTLRLPNRTTFPAAGSCNGPGAIFHHTTQNAINYEFNAVARGPVLGIPPAGGPPAPVPVQVRDDGVNAPTLSPLTTVSVTPWPDFSDARWVVGVPTPGSDPSLTNSVFHLEPGIGAALTTTLTVRPLAAGVATTDFLLDVRGAATRTLTIQNTDAAVNNRLSALQVRNRILVGDAGQEISLSGVSGTSGRLLTTTAGGLTVRTAAGALLLGPLGTLEVNPEANATIALGHGAAPFLVWQSIYLSSTNPGVRLFNGAGTQSFSLDYSTTHPTISSTDAAVAASITITPGNAILNVTGRVDPDGDGTRDLGTLNVADPRRWRNICLSTGITANSSLTIDMAPVGAGNTTLTITNSTAGVANLTVDNLITAASLTLTGSQAVNTVYAAPSGGAGAPAFRLLVALDIPTTLNSTTISTQLTVTTITTPASTRLTLTSLEPATGGADLGCIIDANSLATATADKIVSFRTANTERAYVRADGALFGAISGGTNASLQLVAGVPAFVSSTTLIGIASNAGGGGGTCLIQDATSITGTMTSSGAINSSGGTLQTNTVTRITNGGIANNLDLDGGATGNKLRLRKVTGTAIPSLEAPAMSDRELVWYGDTVLGTQYLTLYDGATPRYLSVKITNI